MAYNIIKGKVEFSNSTTGSIESLVDDWRTQTIGGVKTFSSTVSASAFWDTTAGGEVRALKSLIAGDGADRIITSDGDGTLTAESAVTITTAASVTSLIVSGHVTGSTFSGSAHGITGIILNPDHLAVTNYDGLANRLSASNLVLGIGLSSSVDPGGTGHGPALEVTGGQGITVDTEGVRVLTASNGGLAFTGQTLQVDASKTTNKAGGPSSADEFIIADSSDSDSIKNLTYTQIKTAITDSISAPALTNITNTGNNRLLTMDTSAVRLANAEANLTFDGSVLAVSGNLSVSGAADMPMFFVKPGGASAGQVGINTVDPGTTLQITNLGAASTLGIHRTASAWYSDGDDIGDILWAGSALGSTYGASARIRAEADGSEWNSTSYPSRLTLWTSATGSSSPTQRMVINNSGNVGIATATPDHTLTVAGNISASVNISASAFYGDGSGITGVTGEWDGSHTGNATIIGTLSASKGFLGEDLILDAGGNGKIGVTGDTDLMTLTANQVAVAGTISSSLGITGSSLELFAEGGGAKLFKVINGIVSGSGVSTLSGLTADAIVAGTADINGGTVDNVVIGAGTATSATVTTLNAGASTFQIEANPVAQFIHPGDNSTGGVINLINSRGGSAGQADDFCGGVVFKSKDSGATATQYSKISTKIGSPTNTAEAGYMLFEVTTAGTAATTYLRLDGTTSAITASVPTLFTSNITGSGGVHITGSTPRLAIGDKGGLGPQDGMLFIRPSDTSNKVLALFQAAEADGQRTCFGVTGSGQVLVGGLHLGGVLNVSGSDDEKLISAKSNTLDPAFHVSGSGDIFVGRSAYLSGSVRHNYVVKTTSADTYISGATDRVAIFVLSSPHNAYLPELNDSLNGITITVKSVGSANVTLTGSTNTAQFIDTAANKVLEEGDSVTVIGYTGPAGYEWAILNYYNAS